MRFLGGKRMINGHVIENVLDSNVLFSFDDLSEMTKKIPFIKKLVNEGKINVIIEQTFYLEHYDNSSIMHKEANNFIEACKVDDEVTIFLPHIDLESEAIHVVGYRYA